MTERTPSNEIATALHGSAMNISDEADAAMRRKDSGVARKLYSTAAVIEEEAFERASAQGPLSVDDPQGTVSKAVLGRSAASLYENAGKHRSAVRVAQRTLDKIAGMPVYKELVGELAEVVTEARSHMGVNRVRELVRRKK